MPKVLCLISLVLATLVTAVFAVDAIMGFAGMATIAPLRSANLMMDIGFVIFGGMLIAMSWTTFREQR